eukprot:GGOE01010473.1.p1 GENE.GGOE01010473.1~~GGOE01010473.1.p1  ORF type:complete len:343 (-),score=68.51 GGOE01010473.1:608-1636(-)
MADAREGNLVLRLVCLLAIIALILAAIAMALPFWSEQGNVRFGLWSICITGEWQSYSVQLCTPVPSQGECQGLYDAARAFSVVGIVFIGMTICTSFAIIRHRKLKGRHLSCAVWALGLQSAIAVVFTILCWVLWLAFVETTCGDRAKIQNFGPPWILQVVASGVMLVSCLLACAGGYLIAVQPRTAWRLAQEHADQDVLGTGLNHNMEEDDPWATHQPVSQHQPQVAFVPQDQGSSHCPSKPGSTHPDHVSISGLSNVPADALPLQSSRFKSQYRGPSPNVAPQPPEPFDTEDPPLPMPLTHLRGPSAMGYGLPPPGPGGYTVPPALGFQPPGTQYYVPVEF